MASLRLYLLALLGVVYLCDGYRILVVFPFPPRSHKILGDGVIKHLLDAGHEVTLITSHGEYDRKNLRIVEVNTFHLMPDFSLKAFMSTEQDFTDNCGLMAFMETFMNEFFSSETLQRFLRDPKEQFDLVVAEWMFSEVYSGFSAVFGCPYAWVFPFEQDYISKVLQNGSPASFTASAPTLPARARELYTKLKDTLYKKYVFLAQERELYERNFGPAAAVRGRTLPPYEEVRQNVSMIFGNSHVSYGDAYSFPENYASIGGYHIDTDVKPLPADLQKYLDSAKHGVIYFSMGSNLKSKDWPSEVKRDILQVFGSLPQNVLWKFEEDLQNVPANVKIVKWAPQQSILAHPNVVLFITHGGLLSLMETIHFGKPLVGIPVFADQFSNIDKAVSKGYAQRVDLSYNVAQDMKAAIHNAFKTTKYTERVKQLSVVYHDRLVPPGQELVHWCEHVVATAGAPHLRSRPHPLPFYQRAYLDLFGLFVLGSILTFLFVKRLLSFKETKTTMQSKKIH